MVPVKELRCHPKNPRRGNLAAIQASVRANGFFRPCIVQRSTRHILVGNHRYLAAIAEGYAAVPVLWADVNDKEALRILLVDNRTADLGGYDDVQLAEIVASVERRGGLEGTGYAPEDLKRIVERVSGASDETPKLRRRWTVIVGPDDPGTLRTLRGELEAAGHAVELREV